MGTNDRLVAELIGSLKLRSILKMIREPDQIVDVLLGNHLGLPRQAFTGDLGWARHWTAMIAPDWELVAVMELTNQMFGIRAKVAHREVPVWMAAGHPAIPVCFGGLNRRIDILLGVQKGIDTGTASL